MNNPDFLFGITPGDVIYDIETYPNCFVIGTIHTITKRKWIFEISPRRNDTLNFCLFLEELKNQGCRMIGFNNLGFDYPVIHFIYCQQRACLTVDDIYNKAMSIIDAKGPARFTHLVWESEWLVEQIDLFKIHHFDNVSKSTSLKMLEFNMRMKSIEDLPFDIGLNLCDEQIETLISYMWHDIKATKMFAERTKIQIEMRERLGKKFNRNMMNMSDVKIGETILISEMENRGIKCYESVNNKRVKRQTHRESIDLNSVILDYINFERVEFQNIKNYLSAQVITETKGVFKNLTANIDGIEYAYGTGGIHASVSSRIIETTSTHQIVDVDVASFYPSLAIKNKLFPAHLGEEFCEGLDGVYYTRQQYPKKTAENGAFKLALNGAYGGSNNEYSPFFDRRFTMAITINGQLSLSMLIEQMLKVPGLKMIQANTDGITYLCPNEYLDHTRNICNWWETVTKLQLEETLYKRMFIRDVNNYMAEYESGGLKRIGTYAYETAEDNPGTRELPWHKNWSSRVVKLAAEAALIRGEDIRQFINNHDDIFDFFLRTKVPRNSTLEWGGVKVDNIIRYYISRTGKSLEKIMPPGGPLGNYKRANKLTDSFFTEVMQEIGHGVWDERIHTKNKSMYEERRSGVNTGWNVKICNNLPDYIMNNDKNKEYQQFREDINNEWYVQEVEKIVRSLLD